MSEDREKPAYGFYFQRRRPPDRPKDRQETPEEEALGSLANRTFTKWQLDALQDFIQTLNKDGTPSELVEGALGMYIADITTSRFSGAMGERAPITPEELRYKGVAIGRYEYFKNLLGVDAAWTRSWYETCLRILHNHISRSVNAKAFELKVVAPWSLVAKDRYGREATVKKDNLEAD